MPYYHYTSRKSAQDIMCSDARIRPGRSGKIFLTPTHYLVGHEAAQDLAIEKEVELVIEIPDDRVVNLSAATAAHPLGRPNSTTRSGGGVELTTAEEIDVKGLAWESLGAP